MQCHLIVHWTFSLDKQMINTNRARGVPKNSHYANCFDTCGCIFCGHTSLQSCHCIDTWQLCIGTYHCRSSGLRLRTVVAWDFLTAAAEKFFLLKLQNDDCCSHQERSSFIASNSVTPCSLFRHSLLLTFQCKSMLLQHTLFRGCCFNS